MQNMQLFNSVFWCLSFAGFTENSNEFVKHYWKSWWFSCPKRPQKEVSLNCLSNPPPKKTDMHAWKRALSTLSWFHGFREIHRIWCEQIPFKFCLKGILWLSKRQLGNRIVHKDVILCKTTYHVRESGRLLSALLTTTLTGERFLVVTFPLQVASTLTRTSALVIIAVETIICVAAGSYISVIFDILVFSDSRCVTVLHLYKTYHTINLVISKGIGEIFCSVVVTAFTAAMIYKLFAAKVWRQNQSGDSNIKSGSAKDTNITVMLITVAIAFVVLRAPYTVSYYLLHYGDNIFSDFESAFRDHVHATINFSYTFLVMNYAISFFLYR